jgi:fructose 1,6-bisphosphatase
MKTPATVRHIPPQVSQVCTTRLDVAAYLLVRGFEISDVKLEGPTATFAFKDPDLDGDAAIRDFYNSAQVPANEYADSQKRVRDLLWESKRRG